MKKSKISEGADDDHDEDIVGEDEIINSKIDDVFVQQVEQEINTNERSAMNDWLVCAIDEDDFTKEVMLLTWIVHKRNLSSQTKKSLF